ncbi:hypothetical protein, variant, partial [Capsaspora owczarzaki ATCC 30864]|uniref:hypothetical protein, variant n=1 Tax=Capsaspora owczarzaki (strain ATCC 30864) TaxID=595528 RepID=UPI0003524297
MYVWVQLEQTTMRIRQVEQDAQTADAAHATAQASKTEALQSLQTHITGLLRKKAELVSRLQAPIMSDGLRVDAAFHSETVSLFTTMAQSLQHLSERLKDMAWMSSFSLADGRLETALDHTAAVISTYQSTFQASVQLQQAVASLAGSTASSAMQ